MRREGGREVGLEVFEEEGGAEWEEGWGGSRNAYRRCGGSKRE